MTGFQFVDYLESKGICYKRIKVDNSLCFDGETRFVYVYEKPFDVYNFMEKECGRLCGDDVIVEFDFFLCKEVKVWFFCRDSK